MHLNYYTAPNTETTKNARVTSNNLKSTARESLSLFVVNNIFNSQRLSQVYRIGESRYQESDGQISTIYILIPEMRNTIRHKSQERDKRSQRTEHTTESMVAITKGYRWL